MNYPKKAKFYFITSIFIMAVIATWILVFKTQLVLQYARVALQPILALKPIIILRAGGEDAYLAKTLAKQSSENSKEAPLPRLIETSRLPIRIQFVNLPKEFAEGAGALATIDGKLLLMSRTGSFYQYKLGNFLKLDWGQLPNGLSEYILRSNAPLNSDAMRASSFAYDQLSKRIFVGYTKYVNPDTNRFSISSLLVDPQTHKKQGDWKTEFESNLIDTVNMSHAGAGRVIAHEGEVYFSVGYPDIVTQNNGKKIPASQNPNSSFGKIFHLNVNSSRVNLLSMGHRNVQGMAFTLTGDLLATEHGPQGGDEINIVVKGANFGWPFQTYGTNYGSYNYLPSVNSAFQWEAPSSMKLEEPLYAYVPSIAISPIQLIKGFHPAWDGNMLIGSLKAQSLFRLVVSSGKVVVSEPIWIGHRIRDIAMVPEYGIALLLDDSLLAFLSIDESLLKANKKNAGYNFEQNIKRCLICHHFEQSTPISLAPSLANVLGRKMGGDTFEKYSTAMKTASGVWNKDNLRAYLINPQIVVPGTSMPNLGLSFEEATDIVNTLIK